MFQSWCLHLEWVNLNMGTNRIQTLWQHNAELRTDILPINKLTNCLNQAASRN